MEADTETILIIWKAISISTITGIFSMLILLLISALISGSEVAFFSLSPMDINKLKKKESRINLTLLSLLNIPQRVLATILIANNFVNIGIVLLSTFVMENLLDFSATPYWLIFLIQVVVITFLLLLFGEVIPKIYANTAALSFARFMAIPIQSLDKIFKPLSKILVKSTVIIDKKFEHYKKNISVEDLSEALKLTDNVQQDEKDILEGIVSFGNIDANGIMTPRIDVVAIDINSKFNELLSLITESGFSRIPVFSENFDNIKGIIYTKDLLPYIDKDENFKWQSLIREPYFIPETKKINELLSEFKLKKTHLAIVVDEYGGANGIVTIEDVLEEILGDMNDEFDDDELDYKQIDPNTYIFEGKTLLYDFYKIMEIDTAELEKLKGDADTLAGLFLEIKGEIPQKGETFELSRLKFIAEQVDNRRIKKIKIIRTIVR